LVSLLAVLLVVSCGGGNKKSSGSSSGSTDLSDLTGALESAKSELNDALESAGLSSDSETSDSDEVSSSGGHRKEIEAFLKSYESFVTKAEKAKSGNDTMAMLSLATQSLDLATKSQKLQEYDDWTTADMTKLAALSAKAAAALQ
jgi:hypothetical protein